MSATQKLLGFGVFELNVDTEELFKSAIPVKLPPQPLKLLVLLASRAGQVVPRNEIQQQLWVGETFVDFEHGVNKCINQIRTAVGDTAARPLYLETLPRRGYRFVAPVVSRTVPAPQPKVIEPDSAERSPLPVLIGGRTGAATAEVAAGSLSAAVPDVRTAAEPATEVDAAQQARFRWSRIGFVWIGVAVLLIAVAGGGLYWRWHAHKAPALTEKDTIVLADFDNKTGDPVFDNTLKQGLDIQLGQSPFLNLISQDKVNQTLKLMGRSAGDVLTPEVARDVCQRTGSKAIGLKAVNCETGDVLAQEQKQAAGKEAVLKALDAAAVSLRSKLGESLSSVQKYATPLEEATTPSLDALKAYSQGREMSFAKGHDSAMPFYQRAVELDPNFASAYAAIAGVYFHRAEVGLAAENARKAYELRGKVSERERLHIEASYYMTTTGELEKAAEVLDLYQQTYPRDFWPWAASAFVATGLGNWEKALEEAREAIRLEPKIGVEYTTLAISYASLNRLDEGEAAYKQAEERKIGSDDLLPGRYLLAFLKGDTTKMARLVSDAMRKPGTEDVLLANQADTEGWYGRLKNARELTRRAMDSAQHNDAKETAALYQAVAALREVESGYGRQARADADAALDLAPNRDVRAMAALALARAGDTARAEKLAAELDKAFPLDTIVQRYWLPTIRAAAALQHKEPDRAVELLKPASPIELGQSAQFNVFLCPVYLRGEAYLTLGDGNAAAAEFQKFIDHYGLVVNFPWGALARLGVARANAQEAATDPAARGKARAAYQNFLTLWKDADPDVPILIQAKAEYAKLANNQ
ncbi:MAG: winged helix-turn-helix domain-containing protein [Candidatus Korobacteraceae bacterium]